MKLTHAERVALGGLGSLFLGLVWLVIVLAAAVFMRDAPDGLTLVRQLVAGVIAVAVGIMALGLASWMNR